MSLWKQLQAFLVGDEAVEAVVFDGKLLRTWDAEAALSKVCGTQKSDGGYCLETCCKDKNWCCDAETPALCVWTNKRIVMTWDYDGGFQCGLYAIPREPTLFTHAPMGDGCGDWRETPGYLQKWEDQ